MALLRDNMKSAYTYVPSKLLSGEGEFLRERSFTQWVSPEPNQVATDFMRNLGLSPIYVESSTGNLRRSLQWQPPEGYACDVCAGCTLVQFVEFDNVNIDRGWPLLSLHIGAGDIHSAVWVSPEAFKMAQRFLASYGITPASRMLVT